MAYQWKTIFNPNSLKQAEEVVFSRKANAIKNGTVYLNNVLVIRKNILKHLYLLLGSIFNFFDHINEKIRRGED